jgi:hypothetical protein
MVTFSITTVAAAPGPEPAGLEFAIAARCAAFIREEFRTVLGGNANAPLALLALLVISLVTPIGAKRRGQRPARKGTAQEKGSSLYFGFC